MSHLYTSENQVKSCSEGPFEAINELFTPVQTEQLPDEASQERKDLQFILDVVRMQNKANEQMNNLMNRLQKQTIPLIKDDDKIVAENQDWFPNQIDKEILLANLNRGR